MTDTELVEAIRLILVTPGTFSADQCDRIRALVGSTGRNVHSWLESNHG